MKLVEHSRNIGSRGGDYWNFKKPREIKKNKVDFIFLG